MSFEPIKSHRDLKAYQKAYEAAMQIFELSKNFPKAETFSLTDQIRRCSIGEIYQELAVHCSLCLHTDM
ncbi:MAG: four helix bundle protein [Coleofasciculaceae cyanobacterium]